MANRPKIGKVALLSLSLSLPADKLPLGREKPCWSRSAAMSEVGGSDRLLTSSGAPKGAWATGTTGAKPIILGI